MVCGSSWMVERVWRDVSSYPLSNVLEASRTFDSQSKWVPTFPVYVKCRLRAGSSSFSRYC